MRLGRYKASVEINGQNLLQRVVSRLGFLGGEIIIVIAEGQPPPLTDYPKLKVITDIYPNKGPLVGIYSGLLNSGSAYNLVVACDMPFLNRRLLGYILEVSAGYDVAVPRLGKVVEPLHAVYSRQCLGAIKQLIDQDSLKIDRLLEQVKVRYVETNEIDSFDPEHLSFFNINNKKDLETARELAGRAV